MTRWQNRAYRFRRLILIAGILYTLLALGWMTIPYWGEAVFGDNPFGPDSIYAGLYGTPLGAGELGIELGEAGYAVNLVLVVGLLLLAQWAFLRPGNGFVVRLADQGRPLKSAVIAAAVMSALLTTGLISLLMELPNWWQPTMEAHDGWGIGYIWAGMLVAWGVWAWVFFIYWRQGDRYTQLGKMIRGLIVGSVLEVFIAVPVHVWAARQRECYCCRGTYTTLVLAGTVMLWAFGPGIILLYWREKYRRQRVLPTCIECGYDLRGTIAAGRSECPECGMEFGKAGIAGKQEIKSLIPDP
jgi:hypothetical protein